MMTDFAFSFENQEIHASRSKDLEPEVVFLHGAGQSNRRRSERIASYLTEQRIGCLTFDFPGHGDTALPDGGSSLALRQSIALTSLHLLQAKRAIFGFSMGGHTAIEIGCAEKFGSIVLFCPAVYPDAAIPIPFGPAFTQEIRKPNAWMDSHVFQRLASYTGKILVVIGAKDTVIPTELPEKIKAAASQASRCEILRIPEADHQLLRFLHDNPEKERLVMGTVLQFIQ